jgi:hypothetical protein
MWQLIGVGEDTQMVIGGEVYVFILSLTRLQQIYFVTYFLIFMYLYIYVAKLCKQKRMMV